MVNTIPDDDWEEWDPNSGVPFYIHMIAGSFAGLLEHLLIYPIDTIKTYLQTDGSGGSKELKHVIKTHGRLRLWRGSSTVLVGCIPAHAGLFSIYEVTKEKLNPNPFASSIAGAMGSVTHDLIMSPMDVLKQRMQLGLHSNLFDCFQSVWKKEGLSQLYRSFPTTLAMNIPFQAFSIGTNETLKKVFELNTFSGFFISGFSSGAIAGLLTTPMDVIRTRLNTQKIMTKTIKPKFTTSLFRTSSVFLSKSHVKRLSLISPSLSNVFLTRPLQHARLKYTRPVICPFLGWNNPPGSTTWSSLPPSSISNNSTILQTPPAPKREPYSGAWRAAIYIFEKEGLKGFFRGVRQRVMVQAPGFAISWTAYEMAKGVLLGEITN
jgi:solute carrier family 25 iron transporter 28/37